MENFEEYWNRRVPHGSGFDCKYEFWDNPKYVKAVSYYHVMDANGYYDGYVKFSIIIPKGNSENFKLHFHGKKSQYLNKKYFLRDYMEETILFSLKQEK